jgi:hypothetical protein
MNSIMNSTKRLVAVLILAFCSAHALADQALPEVVLDIRGHKITVEVAATDAARTTGLMHRRMLPENRGMLLVFPYAQPQRFWMKNTYIPLSIAFIDESGAIVSIADMKPLTTDSHASAKPAKYALEMNQGWFSRHNINTGAVLATEQGTLKEFFRLKR